MKALLIPTVGPLTEVHQDGLVDLQGLLHGPVEGLPLDG